MAKTKSSAKPDNRCDLCGFTTRNSYIFKKHRLRCRREKKKTKGGVTKIKFKPSGGTLLASASNFPSPTKVGKDNGSKKASPTRGRNYKCEHCDLVTTKSKIFLYHQIQEHDKPFSIYNCSDCEYSAKHKHKVQRHLKLVHKKQVALFQIKVEYESDGPHVKEKIPDQVEPVGDHRFKYNIDFSNDVDEEIPDDVVVVLPEAPEAPPDGKTEHIREVPGNDEKVYKCEYCLFNSNDKSKVAKHVVTTHHNAKMFHCDQCSFTTGRKIELVAHKAQHRKMLQCEECSYATDNKQNFDEHRENHNVDNTFQCQYCSFSASKEATIARHVQTCHDNTAENSQKTNSSDSSESMSGAPPDGRNFVMGVQSTGTEQYYAHTDTYNQNTSLDYYGDNDQSYLSNYSNSSLNWTTDNDTSLNYQSTPTNKLSPSKRSEKLASKQAAVLQGPDGSFVCPLCGLKYKRSSDLNRHMKQKHSIRMKDYLDQQPTMVQTSNLDLPPIPSSDDLTHVQTSNQDSDQQDDGLSMHDDDSVSHMDNRLQLMDGTFTEANLKCPYCPFEAKWQDELGKHLAIHQVERRYRCPHCEKQYKYVGDLNVHIRKDHKKEPESGDLIRVPTIPNKKSSPSLFKCPSCPFSSQWKTEVDRHSKLHRDGKPYQCNYCPYQTHWKGDVRRHLYKHHPDVMADDPILESVITIDKDKINPSQDVLNEMDNQSNDSLDNSASFYPDRSMSNTPENSMDKNYDTMGQGYDPSESEPSSHEPSPMKEMSPVGDGDNTESQIFKCDYCPFVTNAPSKLKAHVSTHMNLKQYMCPICGRRANWKWDIRKHIKKAHPESPLDVVKLSRQEAEATIEKYINSNPVVRREHHLNVSAGMPQTVQDDNVEMKTGRSFKCTACGYESNQRWIVSKHIRTVHAGMDVNILYRPSKDSMNNTILSVPHTAVKEEIGEPVIISEERAESSSPVPSHTILNVPVMNTAQSPRKDLMSDKPFICMDCGKQCATKADIARHYYYMHRNMAVRVGYITDNGIVPLDKDDPGPKTNPQPSNLPMKIIEPPTEKFLPLDIKPFMCAECGKRAALKGDVKKHFNYMHPGMEVRIIYVGDGMLESGMVESPYLVSTSSSSSSEKTESKPIESSGTLKLPTAPKKALASANPKSFGYTKPFMCSECGRRSNWKWDLGKHMRLRHSGSTTAHIITLSEAEARATYEKYMQEFSQSIHTSPVKKHPSTKLNEKEYQLINFNRSAYRQFKCSVCPYRSNWRSDLLRHIKRKHGVSKGHLIILSIEEAKESLDEYDYNPRKRRRNTVGGMGDGETNNDEGGATKSKTTKYAEADKMGRIWKCARCSFVNKDKMIVARHLYSLHRVRAFSCTKCKYATNHRSSAYRHIKQRHETDNISICKIGIKYIRYDPSRHTYVKSAKEKAKAEGKDIDMCSAAAVGENGQLFPGFKNDDDENLRDDNLKMEEGFDDEFDTTLDDGSDGNDEEKDTYTFKETFKCKLCTFQSGWRSAVCRHIRQKHKSTNYQRHIKCVKKIIKNNDVEEHEEKDMKQYLCTVCPYRTAKHSLLMLHMNCHKPQVGIQQEKCKYCPYYVKAPRLIQQHERLHLEEERKKQQKSQGEEMVPASIPTKEKDDSVFVQPPAPPITKRHQCQKCPYHTNSKNDFYYHKQFHRPKPTSEYKCDECDYWVGLKRLLKQHKKVHQADYKERRSSVSSIQSSPSKSDFSESSYVYDSVQLAIYKQKVIASKIQPSISHSPVMSPMKIACTVGNRPGYVMKNGGYRKVHKCSKCPYQNIRLRNLRLHELMHGYRKSKNQLMKCPDCDYYVGSKGLLSHHMKVHLPTYTAESSEKSSTDADVDDGEDTEKESDISDIQFETKVDTLYEIARFKKYSCEKCPYASAKRSHYEKHVELHGSKQRHMCKYCDYSVPSKNLLVQHERLHCSPNQNLLAIQSLSNLLQLPEVPADVALASALPPIDTKKSYKVSVTHDHIELYENSNQMDIEPKKLYRCDRCPYANVRRDHLLTHLKFHMLKSTMSCPYCDYSVSKQHHLAQHIKVHFCPLPELSNWLTENGQIDRVKQGKDPDISEALYVAQLYKRDGEKEDNINPDESEILNGEEEMETDKKKDDEEDNDKTPVKSDRPIIRTDSPGSDTDNEISFKDSSIVITPTATQTSRDKNGDDDKGDNYVCQYCDREFEKSSVLVQHEMQHLIGNNFEVYLSQFATTNGDSTEPEEVDEIETELLKEEAKLPIDQSIDGKTDNNEAEPVNGDSEQAAAEKEKQCSEVESKNETESVSPQIHEEKMET